MNQELQEVIQFEVESESEYGSDSGFLRVRSTTLRNIRADGSRSRSYVCDFIGRPKGCDAVVVALWHRAPGGAVDVLLRRGLRPALSLGRPAAQLAISEPRNSPYLLEVVAGIIEREDVGRPGVLRRAAIETAEESGYSLESSQFAFLGAGLFPSPGSMPEKFWLTHAQIKDKRTVGVASGDGSPMEEGATTMWMPLDEAIDACFEGRIEDAKTEVCLRRLRDYLQHQGEV